MNTKRDEQRRQGYSLIEMLFVITALAIMIGLAATMIRGLMKLNKTGQTRLAESAALERLARQFRRDAHAAAHAVAGPERVEFTGPEPDHAVKYERKEGVLQREEHAPGQSPRRDVFRLPERGAPVIQTAERDGQTWVALVFDLKDDPARLVPAHAFRVDALVGRDHRALGVAEDKK